ncbi:VWA domain-containing protein [Luteolibacter sp. LG18]|uniref:VWA domain-containing protein n=1 Tax=Luteolibacter sp. LG18 TaxID=2819286 RepID=UPI002B29035E|nr:aerotolerance protein BatA [Luteolibacter sp. LG18]
MTNLLEHFRFAQWQWLLLLLPCLLLLVLRRGRGASAAISFPNVPVLAALGSKVRQGAWNIGLPLAWIALAAAIVALARPVWRNEYQSRSASGIDIVIAFDLSLSMEIDDFIKEDGTPLQRIDAAKSVVKDFISGRPDDRMGLVVFAGKPYKVSPITLDHQWLLNGLAKLSLGGPNSPEPGTVTEQGTAIGSALAASALRLDARDAKSKVIILVTDGANNSGKIAPLEAAEHAKTLGIKIYTVAIGTKEGRVAGNVQRFPRQEFDLPTLQKIAEMTGGEHYYAQTFTKLKNDFKTIDRLEKTEAKSLTVVDDTELFPWAVGAATMLALLSAVILALNPPLSS